MHVSFIVAQDLITILLLRSWASTHQMGCTCVSFVTHVGLIWCIFRSLLSSRKIWWMSCVLDRGQSAHQIGCVWEGSCHVCLFRHVRRSLLSNMHVSFIVAQDWINILRLRSWASAHQIGCVWEGSCHACLFRHVHRSLLSHVQVSFVVAHDLINILRLRLRAYAHQIGFGCVSFVTHVGLIWCIFRSLLSSRKIWWMSCVLDRGQSAHQIGCVWEGSCHVCLFCHVRSSLLSHVQVSFVVA